MLALHKNNGIERNRLFNEFFFDDGFTRNLFDKSVKRFYNQTIIPAVNIKETNKSFELDLAVPGLKKEDFKIEVLKDKMTISTSVQKEANTEDEKDNKVFSHKEFNYHSFSRTFVLPDDKVDAGSITATYQDGILSIILPKRENNSLNSVRQITIA